MARPNRFRMFDPPATLKGMHSDRSEGDRVDQAN